MSDGTAAVSVFAFLSALFFAFAFSRVAAVAVGIVFSAAGLYFVFAGDGLAAGPAVFAAFSLFTLLWAWLVSARKGGDLDAKLAESGRKREELENKLAALKREVSSLARGEKESLLMYSLIKILSETPDPAAVRRLFLRHLRDILKISRFAFVFTSHDGGIVPYCQTENFIFRVRDYDFGKAAGGALAAGGAVIVPVRHLENLCGFFIAVPGKGENAEEIRKKAEDFFARISFAVRRLQLFLHVEALSRTDGLTGVFRRNVLDEKIREEIKRARNFRTTFAFMIADIDHFKRINDTYGHQFGDFVLKKVGGILKSGVYETDFLCRYGGEEFAMLLPRADAEGVLRKAESIRSRIEGEVFTMGFESVKITISMGISHFPRDGSSPEEIIEKADRALYYAKEHGRNMVADIAMIGG